MTLLPTKWLNGDIIDVIDILITKYQTEDQRKHNRIMPFTLLEQMETEGGYNSIKKHKRKTAIRNSERLLFVIHSKVHWFTAVVNLRTKNIEILDSLKTPTSSKPLMEGPDDIRTLIDFIGKELWKFQLDVWTYC
jgi:Ulp1 family protease